MYNFNLVTLDIVNTLSIGVQTETELSQLVVPKIEEPPNCTAKSTAKIVPQLKNVGTSMSDLLGENSDDSIKVLRPLFNTQNLFSRSRKNYSAFPKVVAFFFREKRHVSNSYGAGEFFEKLFLN